MKNLKPITVLLFIIVISISCYKVLEQTNHISVKSETKNIKKDIDKKLLTINSDSVKAIIDKSVKQPDKNLNTVAHTTKKTADKLNFYKATEKKGNIGSYDKNLPDRPDDNIFVVYIEDVSNISEAYLHYDLYGLSDKYSVSRSINNGYAMGGAFVSIDTVWRQQKEGIPVKALKAGKNIIRFTTPPDASYGYSIKNVGIYTVKSKLRKQAKIVLDNTPKQYNNNKAYISGYISGDFKDSSISVTAGEQKLFYRAGEFFGMVSRTDTNSLTGWQLTVTAKGAEGLYLEEEINFMPAGRMVFNDNFNEGLNKTQIYVSKEKGFKLELSGAVLQGDSGAVKENTIITASTLRGVDILPTQSGLVNVTAFCGGYRMLPHGIQFNKPVRIALPYDSTLIPPGHFAEDIRTYYFDEEQKQWVALAFDSLDLANNLVWSFTTHFTDFINGVIEVPESPETSGYTPTGISELDVANPATGIVQIAPPQANNRGTANLNFPIKLPSGRRGMQPQLAVSYTNEGGNGWLGKGWSLSVPSVSVETRWGVPRYNKELETETYNLMGSQLTPVAHRSEFVPRSSEKQFYPRVEGSFMQIIRHGNDPSNYWWEITDNKGTKYYYGSTNGSTVSSTAVLTDANGNIAEWKLTKVTDIKGNTITYTYEQASYNKAPLTGGKYLYLKNINYTGFNDEKGKYNIDFIRQSNIKTDASIFCNYGFKAVDAFLLNRIDISYNSEMIRSYLFEYQSGAFYKTLLHKITELDSEGNEFYSNNFEYYDDVHNEDGTYELFGDAEERNTMDDNLRGKNVLALAKASALGATAGRSWGAGMYAGFGVGGNVFSKNYTAGGQYNYDNSKSEGINMLIDLNGDRLPDKVYIDDGMYYRPQFADGSFETVAIKINTGRAFQKTESKSNTWAFGAYINAGSIGAGKRTTRSTTTNYFSDVNNDGLIDIVEKGHVYYNVLDADGHPTFTTNLNDLAIPTSEEGELDWEMIKPDSLDIEEQLAESPLQDAVKVWQAPYDGVISINAPVQLDPATSAERIVSATADGVIVSIQHKNTILAKQTISADANGSFFQTPLSNINIQKGDRIYFRAQSVTNAMYDRLVWNPVITYTDKDNSLKDVNGLDYYRFDAADDFLLSSESGIGFAADARIRIASYFEKPITTDSIRIEYELRDTLGNNNVIAAYNFAWDQLVSDSIILENIPVEGNNSNLNIRVYAQTNVDWSALTLNTKVSYTQSDDPDILTEVLSDSAMIQYPVPHYTVYNVSKGTEYNPFIVPRNGKINVLPRIHQPGLPSFTVYSGTVNMSVKRNNAPAVNKEINIESSVLQADSLLEDVEVSAGEEVFLEYYTLDTAGFAAMDDSIYIEFIVPDTLIVDTVYKTMIQSDTTIYSNTVVKTWLTDQAVYDTTFNITADGSLTFSSSHVNNRTDIGYPEYILTDTLLTDTLISGTDTTISKTVRTIHLVDSVKFTEIRATACYWNYSQSSFGAMYRNWGQFAYNKGNAAMIDEQDLVIEEPEEEPDIDNIQINGDNFEEQENSFEQTGGENPLKAYFVRMYPNGKDKVWIGQDDSVYIGERYMSSSRRGEKDLVPYTKAEELARTGDYSGIRAIDRKSKNTATMYNAEASFGFSGSYTTSKNNILTDFTDLNGDGFPDIVNNSTIQYSNPTGGLSNKKAVIPEGIAHSISKIIGIALNGRYPIPRDNDNYKYSLKMSEGPGFSDLTEEDKDNLRDINGDGLPDKILSNGKVRFNLGYAFGPEEQWGFSDVRRTESRDLSVSLGGSGGYSGNTISGGINIDAETGEITGGSLQGSINWGSFVFGVGASSNESHANVQFTDVNGDGLVDLVSTTEGDNPTTNVRLNLGGSFAEHADVSWQGTLQNLYSINANLSAAGTFGFTVFGICKFVFNPSVTLSSNFNRTTEQLMDINGDGLPDFLSSRSDDRLTVRPSKIGRTNMLKKVNNPLGSSFTLAYEQKGNTYKMPGKRWVLSQVKVADNHSGDGVDTSLTVYEYGQGFYDRYERTFYGFDTLITKQLDTEHDNALYRSVVQTYLNDNYYTQGMLLRTEMFDGDGNKYTQTDNFYKHRVRGDAEDKELWAIEKFTNKSIYIFMESSLNSFYEGNTTAQKSYRKAFVYDERGNIIKYTDYGDVNTHDPVIEAQISYYSNQSNHIFGIPETIRVSSGGILYKHRETSVNDDGEITQVRLYLNESEFAAVDLEYDTYGNLIRKTMPANYKNERMFFAYTYDDVLHSYITKVTDAFGYSSLSEYDYRMGTIIATSDINKNPMQFSYDAKGRLLSVTGPKEIEAGVDYTIRHSYYPFNAIPSALTEHYDPAHPDNPIQTVIFTDGLGRVIQTKKDITLGTGSDNETDAMSVSGHLVYDAFGRTVAAYYPVTEPVGTPLVFNTTIDDISPSMTTYDVLDRTLSTVLPDGSTATMNYGFGNDRDNTLQFMMTSTDPLGNKSAQFTNTRGQQTASLMLDSIWVSTHYDNIGRPVEVMDPDGNITYSIYDAFDRRIERRHPDAGITHWTFDLAGNMLGKKPEHIPEPVKYEYEYNRLISISYPVNTCNNVKYEYGAPEAADNRAGRLVKIEDATGAQIFSYGSQGEVIKNLRTVVVPDNGSYSFLTLWKYDSWNRLTEMYYPDGEKLTYSYNSGGEITGMSGQKGLNTYEYVKDIKYDKFGQRTYIAYGNGTETYYTYNPKRRWLQTLKTTTAAGRLIQNNSYTYDLVGNILRLDNNADIPDDENLHGGSISNTYTYDNLYRLVSATGTYNNGQSQHEYTLSMSYTNMGDILSKQQVNRMKQNGGEWENVPGSTHSFNYTYNGQKPHTVTTIENTLTGNLMNFTYDASGNTLQQNNSVATADKQMVWTEENRLSAIKAKGNVSHYIYDAGGERILKLKSSSLNININGVSAGATEVDEKFTIYPNAYSVVRKNQYTKHFFLGSQRILTKISNNDVSQSFFEGNASQVGGVDYGEIQEELEQQLLINSDLLNVGWYRNTHGQVPSEHIRHYLLSKEHGGLSGQNPFETLDDTIAVSNPDYEYKQYYFHPDHLAVSIQVCSII